MYPWLDVACNLLKWGTTISAGTVIVVGGGLYYFQTALIYPASMPAGSRSMVDTPSQHGMPEYQDIFLQTMDGERLHCYSISQTADRCQDQPTILLLHANAGNMGHRLPIARVLYNSMECNIFMLSYRGYGKSSGTPNEAGLRIDAQMALNYLLDHPQLKHTKLFVYGQSIGGAVAVDLAHRNQSRFTGVIIENTFMSLRTLIPHVMPIAAPIARFCHQVWPSDQLMATLEIPILFLSGLKDELVPPSHMKALYDTCGSQLKVWRDFPNGTHNDTVVQPGYFKEIKIFIEHVVSLSPSYSSTGTL